VLKICIALMEEKPMARFLAPLMLAVPVVTGLNYAMEEAFARRWERRRELTTGASANGMRAASGEASA